MGTDPPHGSGPGNFLAQCCVADHGETAKDMGGGGLIIFTAGSSNGGGGFLGDRGLHPKEIEHSRAIYCNATNYGPLGEVSEEAIGLGISEVVGARETLSSGREGAGGGDGGRG